MVRLKARDATCHEGCQELLITEWEPPPEQITRRQHWHSQQISFVTLRSSVGKLDWNMKIKKVWGSIHPWIFASTIQQHSIHFYLHLIFQIIKWVFTMDKRIWQRFIWDLAGLLQELLHLKCIWHLFNSFYSFNNINSKSSYIYFFTARSEFFTVSKLVFLEFEFRMKLTPTFHVTLQSTGGDIVCISPQIISSEEEEEVLTANCCCTLEGNVGKIGQYIKNIYILFLFLQMAVIFKWIDLAEL